MYSWISITPSMHLHHHMTWHQVRSHQITSNGWESIRLHRIISDQITDNDGRCRASLTWMQCIYMQLLWIFTTFIFSLFFFFPPRCSLSLEHRQGSRAHQLPCREMVVNGVCGVSSSGSCSEPRLQISLCGFTTLSAAIGISFSVFMHVCCFGQLWGFREFHYYFSELWLMAKEEQDTEPPHILYIFNLPLA